MEQIPSENKNEGFLRKNKYWIIGGIIVLLAVIGILNQRQNQNNQEEEQTDTEGASTANPEQNQTSSNENQTPSASPATSNEEEGNVSVIGTLRLSDDLSRGNLMLASSRGKIYIQTGRDFSASLEKQVTLAAEGTIDSFTFLGFKEAETVTPAPTPTPPVSGNFETSGRLEKSDNELKGNYVISSTLGKIYLESKRDYTGWIGQEVNLTAKGAIESFTEARLIKK